MRTGLLLCWLVGCGPQLAVDNDGDGYSPNDAKAADCDDNDPNVHPDADELCGPVDENCDGDIGRWDWPVPEPSVGWHKHFNELDPGQGESERKGFG